MRCDEFELRLNEVLDQRRRPEADVGLADHARQCCKCRALATSFHAALEGFERIGPVPSLGDLSGRVLATLAPATTLRLPRRRRLMAVGWRRLTAVGWRRLTAVGWRRLTAVGWRRLTALAAAAALLLVIGPWTWFGRGDRAAGPRPPITTPSKLVQAGTGSQPRREKEIAGPYRTLARETTASLSVAMQLLPVESLGFGDTAGPKPRKASTTAPAGWVHGLTDGLTPVTRPTAGVMSSFIELLSSNDEDTRS